MAETLEDLIGTIPFNLPAFNYFCFYLQLNCLLDKATDPSKSQDGVDYTTQVCDRINLDLDG